MITQRAMDNKIQRTQEEISLAEKCIADLMQRKQELQEFIDSLNAVEAEREWRAARDGKYWYISAFREVIITNEFGFKADDKLYDSGNYYLTEVDAIRAEKQIRLFRLLDRFSRQNGWTDEAWEDDKTGKWYIYFNHNINILCAGAITCYRDICQVHFTSKAIAQQAIEKYRDLIMEVMAI